MCTGNLNSQNKSLNYTLHVKWGLTSDNDSRLLFQKGQWMNDLWEVILHAEVLETNGAAAGFRVSAQQHFSACLKIQCFQAWYISWRCQGRFYIYIIYGKYIYNIWQVYTYIYGKSGRNYLVDLSSRYWHWLTSCLQQSPCLYSRPSLKDTKPFFQFITESSLEGNNRERVSNGV